MFGVGIGLAVIVMVIAVVSDEERSYAGIVFYWIASLWIPGTLLASVVWLLIAGTIGALWAAGAPPSAPARTSAGSEELPGPGRELDDDSGGRGAYRGTSFGV